MPVGAVALMFQVGDFAFEQWRTGIGAQRESGSVLQRLDAVLWWFGEANFRETWRIQGLAYEGGHGASQHFCIEVDTSERDLQRTIGETRPHACLHSIAMGGSMTLAPSEIFRRSSRLLKSPNGRA